MDDSAALRAVNGGACFTEAALGGPIAGVRDGDTIRFDVRARVLEVEISDDVLRERMAQWRAPQPRYPTGVFAKYGALCHRRRRRDHEAEMNAINASSLE